MMRSARTLLRSKKVWLLKYLLMNMVSRLPFHEELHYRAQALLGRHELDAPPTMLRRSTELFRLLRHVGERVEGRVVFEIGTGWFPFTAILAHLLGAREVITVDIHPWLKLDHAAETLDAIRRLAGPAVEAMGGVPAEFERRTRALSERARAAKTVDELFRPADVRYMPHTDLLQADFPDGTVDVVFSSNVLEHIPPDVLADIHRRTARMATPRGVAIHRVNPDDHFKALAGSSIAFLEYDERAWRWLGGYGLSYHNRLRSREHVELLARTPWRVSLWADALDREALDQLERRRIVLAGRFAGMAPEVVCAFYTWLVLRLRADGDEAVAEPTRVEWIDELIGPRPAGLA